MWEEAGEVARVVPSGERDAGWVLGHSCPPGHRQGAGSLLVPGSQPVFLDLQASTVWLLSFPSLQPLTLVGRKLPVLPHAGHC